MKHCLTLLGIGFASLVALTGCVDDAYDLSDVNTTTRLTVDNLVVPMNLDNLTLSDMIKLEDEKDFGLVTIDGKEVYAFNQNGTFHSDPIHIEEVTAKGPELSPTNATLPKIDYVTSFQGAYNIQDLDDVDFEYNFDDVDSSVHQIDAIKCRPSYFDIKMEVIGSDNITLMGFDDIKFEIPKGLTCTTDKGKYDPETGVLTIDHISGAPEDMKIRVTVTGFDFKKTGAVLDYTNHKFDFGGSFKVIEGILLVNVTGSVPSSAAFQVKYTITDIEATALTGKIEYNLDGISIDDVSLSDLPDFLTDPETNILLDNPQIYLNVNNPVGNYDLNCQAGLEIRPIRANGNSPLYTLNDGLFTIPDSSKEGPYNFVMSPSKPESVPDGYASGLKWLPFSELSKVVGDGPVPDKLEINLVDPKVPLQTTKNFPLGSDLSTVDGDWEFLAPLNLDGGSVIIYTDEDSGWASEDLDALVINALAINGVANSDAPFQMVLTVEPLDANLNIIPGVEIKPIDIPAQAKDYPFEFKLEKGVITGLDGIRYKAYVKVPEGQSTGDLTPDVSINLGRLQLTVGGYWEKEL